MQRPDDEDGPRKRTSNNEFVNLIYQDSMRPGIAPIAQVSYGGKGGLFSLLEKNQPHFLAMQMQHQHLNVS